MKSLKMENRLIQVVFEFLREVTLKGKASRGRSKLLKRLEEKDKELQENRNEIRKEYFEVDENGEFKIDEDGTNLIFLESVTEEDKKILTDSLLDLDKEPFEITFTEYSTQYEALFKALDNLDEELSGNKALAYDELMTAYENNKEEK